MKTKVNLGIDVLFNKIYRVKEKKNLAVVCGGFSNEKVISGQSADVVIQSLKGSDYNIFKVWIDENQWSLLHEDQTLPIDKNDFSASTKDGKLNFDGVFNTIHGTPGENGILQGYFDLLKIPYNNCGVYASSITFNKGACNRLLRHFGVKSANSYLLKSDETYSEEKILERVGLPCFVKPNASGSSLGISRVNDAPELKAAIDHAFIEDDLVIIEEFLPGTEITCGVVERDGKPKALAVTEIVVEKEFFDYEAKYHHKGTQEITPARISKEDYEACMRLTEQIYTWLDCQGIVRADYILNEKGIFLIEVNTTPGLSSASLVPQMAVYAGYTLEEFFSEEVELLLNRH
ncbi:MAG TPA: D-alanine--D-alanine ligase [Flavobacteriales bacterium]|jgi:D-alanine-D-alanine ligase|nr:D-alanine--D-alanine ligase [Salibacteraceae bacterium]HAS35774.1 D-alanine--D-alanine ligase [Flavobacteriales bacterium]